MGLINLNLLSKWMRLSTGVFGMILHWKVLPLDKARRVSSEPCLHRGGMARSPPGWALSSGCLNCLPTTENVTSMTRCQTPYDIYTTWAPNAPCCRRCRENSEEKSLWVGQQGGVYGQYRIWWILKGCVVIGWVDAQAAYVLLVNYLFVSSAYLFFIFRNLKKITETYRD